jgi:transcriptional activator protein UGA3
MCDQNLPGYCSSHWVLFCTAVCAVPGQQEEGEMDDRERVDRLYEDTMCVGLDVTHSNSFIHDRNTNLFIPLYRVERESAGWEM